MTDKQIIDRLSARDETALEMLRRTYGTMAMAVAQRIVQSREIAEECIQDGLMAIWETIPPKHPESLQHYFTTLVRNSALSCYRAGRREKRGGGEIPLVLDELSYCASAQDDVEEEVGAHLLEERINDFLAALPERERDIFLRRYYYLEDLDGIAECYSLSKRHVSVLLFRTRKKLKTFLKKEDLL